MNVFLTSLFSVYSIKVRKTCFFYEFLLSSTCLANGVPLEWTDRTYREERAGKRKVSTPSSGVHHQVINPSSVNNHPDYNFSEFLTFTLALF